MCLRFGNKNKRMWIEEFLQNKSFSKLLQADNDEKSEDYDIIGANKKIYISSKISDSR